MTRLKSNCGLTFSHRSCSDFITWGGDLGAAIHLREDAIEAELVLAVP